jgi:2-polyprenyl-6-methoxyphenol hydroxylase-like FAD-dependent oxidoreductase
MNPPRHALIIGAGIAGPALALFLKRAGIASTIYEARAESTDIGGALQIAPNGMQVASELGLRDRLLVAGTTCDTMVFLNRRGKVLARVAFGERAGLNQPAITLKRADLHRALDDEATRQNIKVSFGRKLVAVEDQPGRPVRAIFADGSSAEGDFLVAADGLWSSARAHVVPNAPEPHFVGLLGIGGFVPRAALEAFPDFAEHTMYMMFSPGGFFGFGYGGSDATTGAGWWVNPARAQPLTRAELAAQNTEELRADLLARHRGAAPPVEALIRATAAFVNVGNIYDVARLPTWHRGRVGLIGDAAHAVSPNSGQGASLALEDALCLAQTLRGAVPAEQAFAQFEATRRERVENIIAYGRRAGDDKKVEGAFGLWLRDRLIALVMPAMMRRNRWIYDYRLIWTD